MENIFGSRSFTLTSLIYGTLKKGEKKFKGNYSCMIAILIEKNKNKIKKEREGEIFLVLGQAIISEKCNPSAFPRPFFIKIEGGGGERERK